MSTFTWIGPTFFGDWDSAPNWSGGPANTLPGPSDDVVFPKTTWVTHEGTASDAVHSISGPGAASTSLFVDGGELEFLGKSTLGYLDVGPGGAVSIGDATLSVSSTVINSGALDLATTTTPGYPTSLTSTALRTGTLYNYGTLSSESSDGWFPPTINAATVDNFGQIDAWGTDLAFNTSGPAGLSFDNLGKLDVRASHTVTFNGGTFTMDPGGLLDSDTSQMGTFDFEGVNLQLGAPTVGLSANVTFHNTTVNSTGKNLYLYNVGRLRLDNATINVTVDNYNEIDCENYARLTAALWTEQGSLIKIEGTSQYNYAYLPGFVNNGELWIISVVTNTTEGPTGPGYTMLVVNGTLTNRGWIEATASTLCADDIIGSVLNEPGSDLDVGWTSVLNMWSVYGPGVTFGGSTVVAAGGSLTEYGTATFGGATTVESGGSLTVYGTVTDDNPETGSFGSPGSSFDLAGPFSFTNANITINNTRLILDGPNATIRDLNTGHDALAHLARNQGSISLQNGAALTTDQVLVNGRSDTISDTISVSSSTLTVGSYWQLANSVTYLDYGVIRTQNPSGWIQLDPSSTLEGDGTINTPTLYNQGKVAPATRDFKSVWDWNGWITLNGSYVQGPTGVLLINVLNTTSVSKFFINGSANLAGSLVLMTPDGTTVYVQGAYRWYVLDAYSMSGTFSTVTFPTSSSGWTGHGWAVHYDLYRGNYGAGISVSLGDPT
jgi:hypothetical protein